MPTLFRSPCCIFYLALTCRGGIRARTAVCGVPKGRLFGARQKSWLVIRGLASRRREYAGRRNYCGGGRGGGVTSIFKLLDYDFPQTEIYMYIYNKGGSGMGERWISATNGLSFTSTGCGKERTCRVHDEQSVVNVVTVYYHLQQYTARLLEPIQHWELDKRWVRQYWVLPVCVPSSSFRSWVLSIVS